MTEAPNYTKMPLIGLEGGGKNATNATIPLAAIVTVPSKKTGGGQQLEEVK